ALFAPVGLGKHLERLADACRETKKDLMASAPGLTLLAHYALQQLVGIRPPLVYLLPAHNILLICCNHGIDPALEPGRKVVDAKVLVRWKLRVLPEVVGNEFFAQRLPESIPAR